MQAGFAWATGAALVLLLELQSCCYPASHSLLWCLIYFIYCIQYGQTNSWFLVAGPNSHANMCTCETEEALHP
jgi:hypothetical protein